MFTEKQFKVTSRSQTKYTGNMSCVIMVGTDGSVYEMLVNYRYGWETREGAVLKATVTDKGTLVNIEGVSYEQPRRLQDSPQPIVAEIWKKETESIKKEVTYE